MTSGELSFLALRLYLALALEEVAPQEVSRTHYTWDNISLSSDVNPGKLTSVRLRQRQDFTTHLPSPSGVDVQHLFLPQKLFPRPSPGTNPRVTRSIITRERENMEHVTLLLFLPSRWHYGYISPWLSKGVESRTSPPLLGRAIIPGGESSSGCFYHSWSKDNISLRQRFRVTDHFPSVSSTIRPNICIAVCTAKDNASVHQLFVSVFHDKAPYFIAVCTAK